MLSTSFGAKTTTLYSSQNSRQVGQKGIFLQILPKLFFIFFFYRIFNLFRRHLNILYACLGSKMPTLYSGQNSWPLGQMGIFEQILHEIFFFFWKNFQFFSWITKYAICKFWCKNGDIVFQSKYLTSWTKGHFRRNFTRVFLFIYFSMKFSTCFWDLWIYYLQVFVQKWWHCTLVEILDQSERGAFLYKIYPNYFFLSKELSIFLLTSIYAICIFWCKNADIVFRSKFLTSRTKGHSRTNFTRFIFLFFFFYIIFHLFLRPLNILCTSFRPKMVTLHSGQNSWPVGIRGIFEKYFTRIFCFSFLRIFHFFLGPLNMLSASFGAKTTTLYSSQNTLLVEQKGIFVQILPEFFYLFIFQ